MTKMEQVISVTCSKQFDNFHMPEQQWDTNRYKNCCNKCDFFAIDTDSCIVSKNVKDQVISEYGYIEILNIKENFAVCGEVNDTATVEVIKSLENDPELEEDEDLNCVSPPYNQELHAVMVTVQIEWMILFCFVYKLGTIF